MIDVTINAERAGRVKKPARYIEFFDPETGEHLGTVSFTKYGFRDKSIWAVTVSPKANTRIDLQLESSHSPEILAGGYGGRGGTWRFDPSNDKERKSRDLIKAVERITGSPVEAVKIETRLELDDPEWWERE